MRKIEIEVPEGKKAVWKDDVLCLVDEKDTRPVMERVKTFADACKELGIDMAEWMEDKDDLGIEPDVVAYLQLRIIVAALNEGWKPKFVEGESRYFPYFYLYTKEEVKKMDDEEKSRLWLWGGDSFYGAYCGLAYSHSNNAWASSAAYFSARLALKSSELAVYCGTQFKEIWAKYVLTEEVYSGE